MLLKAILKEKNENGMTIILKSLNIKIQLYPKTKQIILNQLVRILSNRQWPFLLYGHSNLKNGITLT